MGHGASPVAVRSSATAEDTAAASFAGMNETFINVRGGRAARRGAPLLGIAVRRAVDLLPREARARQAAMDIAVVVQRDGRIRSAPA